MLNPAESLIDRAFRYHALGFIVIPELDKIPLVTWKEWQTKKPDETRLKEWFESYKPTGLGLVMGETAGLVCVDLDDDAAVKWAAVNLPSSPLKTKTRHGEHWFYRWNPAFFVGNKTTFKINGSVIRIDIKGHGGKVTAPGSRHQTGFIYQELTDWSAVNLAALPPFQREWFPINFGEAAVKPPAVPFEIDDESRAALQPAVEELVENFPEAVCGQGGDAHTFKLAAALVNDFALADTAALDLMKKWNQDKNAVRWSENDLMTKIENARKYAQGQKGSAVVRLNNQHTPESIFQTWIEDNGVVYRYNGQLILNGEEVTPVHLASRCFLDLMQIGIKFSRQLVAMLVDLWIDSQPKYYIEAIKERVAFKGNNVGMEIYIKALTGETDVLDVAVMNHFIWQVKRKLLKMPVTGHIMPVMVGESGSGKSTALFKLLSPLGDLIKTSQLTTLADSREYAIFTRYYVVCFDEMAKAARADVESLKQMITSDTVNYRLLGTNSQMTGRNVSTFIGTSNNDVQDTIKDPTSARRYYQLNCQERCDWETINAINYGDLWTAVDPLQDSPLNAHSSSVLNAQEAIRFKTSVEEWALERELISDDDGRLTNDELYNNYKAFMDYQNMGNRAVGVRQFGRELAGMGLKPFRQKDARGWMCKLGQS